MGFDLLQRTLVPLSLCIVRYQYSFSDPLHCKLQPQAVRPAHAKEALFVQQQDRTKERPYQNLCLHSCAGNEHVCATPKASLRAKARRQLPSFRKHELVLQT